MNQANHLTVTVYSSGTTPVNDPDGDLTRAQGINFRTGYPGGLYLDAELFIPRDPTRPWQLKQNQRLVIRNGTLIVYEGYISNLSLAFREQLSGNLIEVQGAWGNLLNKRRWQKWWADTRLTETVWVYDETATGAEKCAADYQNRLRLTPRAEAWTSGELAAAVYTMPTGETIKRVTCNYDLSELGVFVPVAVKKTTNRQRFEVTAALDDDSDTWMTAAYDGDTGTSYSLTMLTTNTLYVGADEIPTGTVAVQFNLGTFNNNLSVLSAEYSSATGWSSVAIVDGTALGGATLAQDGNVTFTAPQDWTRRSVLKKNRHWVRFVVSLNCDAVSILDFVDGLTSTVADGDTVTLTDDDYLFIGHNSQETFTGVRFDLGGSVNNNVATLAAEYWNVRSEEWASLTITDGTAVGGATLGQDGDLTFTTPDDMGATAIGGVNAVWLRLRPSADLDAVIMTTIRALGQQQWELRLRDTVGAADIWSVTANGTGSQDSTLGTPRQALALQLIARGAYTPSNDGAYYGEVSNVVVYSETGAINLTAVAQDVRAELTNLSSYEGLIGTNSYSLVPFGADWLSISEILDAAAQRGDGSQNSWAVGVRDSEQAVSPDGKPVLFAEQFPALTDWDYEISTHDPHLGSDLQLDYETNELWNWIIVAYFDAQGTQTWISPDNNANLKDTTSITDYGQRDYLLTVTEAADAAAALEAGRRFLAQHKDRVSHVATPLSIVGAVPTKEGYPIAASEIRAGKRIKITDYLDDGTATWRIHRIVYTSYEDATETCTVEVDKVGNLPVWLAGLEAQLVSWSGGGVAGGTHAWVRQLVFTIENDLSVESHPIRIPNQIGVPLTISQVALNVGTAPTGAAIIVDVNKNGTTIFTNQANRPQVAAGAYSGTSTTIDVIAWADDDYLTVDVDQIGSTLSGSDLAVTIVCS